MKVDDSMLPIEFLPFALRHVTAILPSRWKHVPVMVPGLSRGARPLVGVIAVMAHGLVYTVCYGWKTAARRGHASIFILQLVYPASTMAPKDKLTVKSAAAKNGAARGGVIKYAAARLPQAQSYTCLQAQVKTQTLQVCMWVH